MKEGRLGMPGLINALRELDYSNPDDVVSGFAINKALERLTKGFNQRYRNVEKPSQDDIYYNNTVVKNWIDLYKDVGATEEKWNAMLSRNANREKMDEDK